MLFRSGDKGDKGDTGTPDYAFVQKVVTVSSDQIAQKSIILDIAPFDPLSVSLTILGGIEQFSGIDFIVINTVLSWSQLSLELLIEAGQHLVITYKPLIT